METKELDLCEILKDCPKGTKLYSTDYGYLEFFAVDTTEDFPIIVKPQNNNLVAYLSDGRRSKYEGAECCLFPSKENRDWSTWKNPKIETKHFDPKTLKPFDKVLVRMFDKVTWLPAFFAYVDEDGYIVTTHDSFYVQCIPYNKDTQHLAGTGDNAPDYYKYWED